MTTDRMVVFPVHPRTRQRLQQQHLYGRIEKNPAILATEPLSYFEFLKLVSNASVVITDSGGIQEETSFLKVPCITFRKNTERPVTVETGTNLLLSIHAKDYYEQINNHIQAITVRSSGSIPFWDDQVSKRILDFIRSV